MLEINALGLERVFELVPRRFEDNRGHFCESYNQSRYIESGIDEVFIQDNNSRSLEKGTLRGLHLQLAPKAQSKLVTVVKGSVFDVAVDIRKDSPDFGKWASVVLTAEKGNQIFLPAGFAHGFLTLEDDTHVTYKVDNYYSGEHDRSIHYADPLFNIDWPDVGRPFILSDKDQNAPMFQDLA